MVNPPRKTDPMCQQLVERLWPKKRSEPDWDKKSSTRSNCQNYGVHKSIFLNTDIMLRLHPTISYYIHIASRETVVLTSKAWTNPVDCQLNPSRHENPSEWSKVASWNIPICCWFSHQEENSTLINPYKSHVFDSSCSTRWAGCKHM